MTLWQYLERCEAEFLARLMARHRRNAAAAAKEAGMHRATLYRRLSKYRGARVYGNDDWRALQ